MGGADHKPGKVHYHHGRNDIFTQNLFENEFGQRNIYDWNIEAHLE